MATASAQYKITTRVMAVEALAFVEMVKTERRDLRYTARFASRTAELARFARTEANWPFLRALADGKSAYGKIEVANEILEQAMAKAAKSAKEMELA